MHLEWIDKVVPVQFFGRYYYKVIYTGAFFTEAMYLLVNPYY